MAINLLPDFSLETAGSGLVAGIDEAGRGPWAGPVVAAAVIFTDEKNIPSGIHDSKKLSKPKREALFEQIKIASHWGVGLATVEEIDQFNILGATKLAMQRAVANLPVAPQLALVDGNQAPQLPCMTQTVVKGDSKSLSIAAASILAKVTRDGIMEELHAQHPHYAWDRNAGYGTPAHQLGLAAHGITKHHRRSFKPIQGYALPANSE